MHSLNGGYVMIDLKNADFSGLGDGVLVSGVFEKIKAAFATGKQIIACNLTNVNDNSPVEMSVTYDSTNDVFLVDMASLSVEVGEDDTFRKQE